MPPTVPLNGHSSARGLIAHAAWLPSFGSGGPVLALWAESSADSTTADPYITPDPRLRPHPFAARHDDLDAALDRLWRTVRSSAKPRTARTRGHLTLWLPAVGATPLPSPELLRAGWAEHPATAPDAEPSFASWRIPALLLEAEAASALLSGLPFTPGSEAIAAADASASRAPRILFGGDLRYWCAAATFALDLLVRQRFLPAVTAQPVTGRVASYGSRALVASYWRAALGAREDATRFEQLSTAMPDLCRASVLSGAETAAPERVPAARPLLESFLHAVVSARVARWLSREGITLRIPPPITRTPYGARTYRSYAESSAAQNTVAARWLQGLHAPGRALQMTIREAQTLLEGAEQWTAEIVSPDRAPFRLCLRILPPEESAPTASDPNDAAAQATWRLDYLLQDRDDPSLLVSLDELWRLQGSTATLLDRRFEHPHERVFAALGQAARLFPPILTSLRAPHPAGVNLTSAEAYAFLRDAVPLLEDAGLGVLVPSWWTHTRVKPALRLRLRGPQKTSTGLMSMDALVAFDWKVALGGQELSREELEQLAALKEPLVRLRGSWIELPREQAQAALRFVQAHPDGAMTLPEALRATLSGEMEAGHEPGVAFDEVRADEWIGDLLARLGRADVPLDEEPPAGLDGTLRPYQLRGLAWLDFLTRYGLGACLADDMGLGKCCLPGTRISTLAGPIRIESLWERELSQTEPDDSDGEWGTLAQPVLVNTFDGGDIVARPVHRVYRQRINEPCAEVHLADGSRLSSTKRHRYLTPSGWKMAGELQAGDLVAVAARTPHIGSNEMPAELAELMAWQLAEGFESEEHHNGVFNGSEPVVLARFRSLAFELGIALPEARPTRTTMVIGTNRLFHLFEPWGYEWGHRSAVKVVPESVLAAPLESQRAFITAMMDAEGRVGKTHCEFASASPSITFAMQDMLRHFGVWMRTRVAMKRATTGTGIARPYFISTFGGNSVARFAEHFRLLIPYKQEALLRLATVPHNTNVEGIPTQAVVATMQARQIPLRSVGLRTVYEWQGMGEPLATSVAVQLREKGHADLAEEIEGLTAPGIHWCKVKSIAEIQYDGYVYDLEVPITHNYVANGIVTHNTVQLISMILRQKQAGVLTRPVLLVCPTSVVGNWRHETARFAPGLRLLVHHGAGRVRRVKPEAFAAEIANYDLVVTTYGLLPRDLELLSATAWGGVVLDEAQNIKNAEARQSRSARKLTAPVRVALTGTPVENRLSELWAIMDFLNPGYLGSHKRFHQRFAVPIEMQRDAEATERLQRLARPFILRRLKTDPTVISDLPEKIEMKEYCPLTREQVTLYEAVMREGLRRVEEAAGDMERRGAVLATLTRLKQVCNHPAHLLGDGSALAGRSGKLARLEELIDELLAEGDRALIFTQFTGMGDRLQPYLAERFGVEVYYLHGGTPQARRERMVERFQSEEGPPLFLLSLKAGGTGLNLMRANHVIHYDRWWNPAVENQATDRAFRIGQTRNVQVRKLVCSGTLEERIDAMIEQKRDLAEHVVGSGEGWLTELSSGELRELFSLRADALAE